MFLTDIYNTRRYGHMVAFIFIYIVKYNIFVIFSKQAKNV
jgi:hypothetical protein